MSSRAPTEEDAIKFGFTKRRPSATAQQIVSSPPPTGSALHPTPGPQIEADEYPMNFKKRGYAVIFNHTHFKIGQAPRAGAEQDVKALEGTLSKIGFTVVLRHNLKKSQIIEELNTLAKLDHSDSDCFMIVVMTHGDSKELCAYDQSYDVSKLWESLKGEKCPTLIGKPKLIFIQACRGDAVDSGVHVTPFHSRTVTDGSAKAYYVIPNYADILIANATFEGHYAWRNGESGSWFIQAICKEFTDNEGNREICDILTRVNRRVAITQASYVPGNLQLHLKKQMPNFLSTLTRQLYFRPKK